MKFFTVAELPRAWKVLLEQVEQAWLDGDLPDLRQLAQDTGVPLGNSRFLRELVLVDMEHRWASHIEDFVDDELGARPWWPDYIRILPELGDFETLGVWPIAESYWLLRSLGHAIDREQFIASNSSCDRQTQTFYPELSTALDLIEADFDVEHPGRAESATASLEHADVSAPLLFSDYLLEAMLGAGGTGKVYRALQKSTGNYVAIKTLLKKRQRDPEAVAQFVEEARIVQRLDHPAIVATHGLGKYPGGGYFLAMDLVVGQNLQSRLEKAYLLLPTAIAIVGRVAEAITYAHSQGVLHGDLKPSNVLLDETMRPFVVDFGMADLLRSDETESPRGGTPAYMSPEQLDDTLGPLSPATDIYGLGGLLYASLTGRAPHIASGANDSLEAMIARPIDFGEPMAKIPSQLVEICGRALHADPRARFQSAGELAIALREVGGK